MWSSTVGLVNGKHRYLTAETFGFKVNSNGQQLKRRQQWTIEPFPENTGPDGSISSAASVSSSQWPLIEGVSNGGQLAEDQAHAATCIMTLSSGPSLSGFMRHSANGSNNGSDHSDGCDEEHENVALKSHLNKYLAVDSFGNVTCNSEEKTESARFTIIICSMSQGKSKDEHIFWAFKNVERGYYLGTTDDGMICCNAKVPKSRAELWHMHLLPARGASFFALKSLGRKRFARVCNEQVLSVDTCAASQQTSARSQVQLDANISWGSETLFQFKYFDGGRYALLTSDNKYLTNEGKCLQVALDRNCLPTSECLFTLEYHSGYMAFRDSFGHYLAAAGRSSILRSRSIGVSRDELFLFEGVPIQVSFKATFNNRWVSIKQGVDVSANQMETTSKFETFQLTYHKQTQLWSIMTQECNFWTISKNTNTVCVCKPADYEALTRGQFKLLWSDNDATLSLKYIDHLNKQAERSILARKSGQLYLGLPAGSSQEAQAVRFIMRFQNRRLLNLRPVDGSCFVGFKCQTGSKPLLEANKTAPDSIQIEYSELPACLTQSGPQDGFLLTQQQQQQMSDNLNDGNNSVIEDSNNSKVISVFNVKLNSTKKRQNIFADMNAPRQQQHEATAKSNINNHDIMIETSNALEQQNGSDKKIDCLTIDSNNNEPDHGHLSEPEQLNGGGVECAAAPSVASIINTFSNVRLAAADQQQQQQQQQQQTSRPIGSLAVSKLASTFEQQQQQLQTSNTPMQSNGDQCSYSNELSSSVLSSNSSAGSANGELITMNSKLADQVAQFECCYMKTVTNGKYLVVGSALGATSGDNNGSTDLGFQQNSSVICDATNRACAQTWILELRSHNSIAIRASDTQAYMQLGTNGTIYLSRCESKDASLWEF